MKHKGPGQRQMQLLQQTLDTHPHKPFKNTQLGRVHKVMLDGKWHTLGHITYEAKGMSETSASARLRDLRKVEGHEHIIHKREQDRRVSPGIWLYMMEEKNG